MSRSSVVQIPLNASLSADSTEWNIQNLEEPQFRSNYQTIHKRALTNMFREDIVENDLYITTEGRKLSYDNGTIIADGRVIANNLDNRGVESTQSSKDEIKMTYYGLYSVRQVNNNTIEVTNPDETITTWTVPETINKFCIIKDLQDDANVAILTNEAIYINDTAWYSEPGWCTAVSQIAGDLVAIDSNGITAITVQGNLFTVGGLLSDYGIVIRNSIPINGNYIGQYNGNWVVTHKPIVLDFFNPGAIQAILDIETNAYVDTPLITPVFPPGGDQVENATVADYKVGPGYVQFVIRYWLNEGGPSLFWYYSIIDDDWKIEDWSITQVISAESIIGSFDEDASANLSIFNTRTLLAEDIYLLWNAGGQFGISYADELGKMGVILTGFGTLNTDSVVDVKTINDKTYITYKDEDNIWNLITISDEVERFKRVSNSLIKVNTLSTNNLLVETAYGISIQQGSLDYNNRWHLKRNSYDMASILVIQYYLNTGFNINFENETNRSLGFVGGTTIFPLRGNIGVEPGDNCTIELLSIEGTALIDVFWVDNVNSQTIPIYRYSTDGNKIVTKPKLIDLPFSELPVGVIALPVPIGAGYDAGAVLEGSTFFGSIYSAPLMTWDNNSYDGYYSSNMLYNSQGIFSLLGSRYSYDGSNIFLIEMNGNFLSDVTAVAPALDYKFLGASPIDAYFYNTYDKSFYIFGSDRRLIFTFELSAIDDVTVSRFSTADNALWAIAGNKILTLKNGTLHDLPNDNGYDNIQLTKQGAWITNKNGATLWTILPRENSTVQPFLLEVNPLGGNGSTILSFNNAVLRLYSDDRNEVTLNVTTSSINTDSKLEVKTQKIIIKPADWDKANTRTIKITPAYSSATAFGFKISSDDKFYITNIEYNVEPSSSKTGVTNRMGV